MTTSNNGNIQKGDELELRIESLAFGGMGVARYHDFVVFIKYGLPGQKVRIRIYNKQKQYAQARLLAVLEQSPDFVEPKCEHFGECGGCLLQHLDYRAQLNFKHQQVIDSLERLGGFNELQVEAPLPSKDIFFYRNKMEFSLARYRWRSQAEIASEEKIQAPGLYAGLHASGFYDKIIDVKKCWLLSNQGNEILHVIRDFARQSGEKAYSTLDHRGYWRFLVIREGKMTGQVMVNLVTSRYDANLMQALLDHLLARFPLLTCVINNINSKKSSIAFGEQEYLLAGNPTIIDTLGPFEFEISANSFFQTHTVQAKKLYDVVAEQADLQGNEIVYDLYSGTGTITIYLSKQAKKLIGFEIIESALANARKNAARNRVENCTFVQADLMRSFNDARSLMALYGQPDVMIIDPPRGGMHPKTIKGVLDLKPNRIVYVSCNPASLARDLAILCKNDYGMAPVYPVDMFPHTAHIEVVVRLDRKVK